MLVLAHTLVGLQLAVYIFGLIFSGRNMCKPVDGSRETAGEAIQDHHVRGEKGYRVRGA